MERKIVSCIVKCAAFLALTGVILWNIFLGLLRNSDSSFERVLDFAKLPADTTDVLFIGSSHVYYGISPSVLWERQGIAGYNVSSAGQNIQTAYFDLREALKTQAPRLIVMDMFVPAYNAAAEEPAKISPRGALGQFSPILQLQRVAAIPELSLNERIAYYLQYPVVHDQYGKLPAAAPFVTVPSFHPKGEVYNQANAAVRYGAESYIDAAGVTARTPLSGDEDEYLRKIAALCQERGLPLLLISTPYPGADGLDASHRGFYKCKHQEIYNTIGDTAQELGVPYVNFDPLHTEIGLDPAWDFIDYHHLSYSGMDKFSTYLGAYLKANYDLPDRRGDAAYAGYDDAAAEWERFLSQQNLRLESGLAAYCDRLTKLPGGHSIVISKGGTEALPPGVRESLAALGVTSDMYDSAETGGGAFAFSKGKMQFWSEGKASYACHLLLNKSGVELTDGASVKFNGTEYQTQPGGVAILVYDDESDELVDAVNYAPVDGTLTHTAPTMQPGSF